MDPRDHKGEEGVTEAAEDGMPGAHIKLGLEADPALPSADGRDVGAKDQVTIMLRMLREDSLLLTGRLATAYVDGYNCTSEAELHRLISGHS